MSHTKSIYHKICFFFLFLAAFIIHLVLLEIGIPCEVLWGQQNINSMKLTVCPKRVSQTNFSCFLQMSFLLT